MEAILCTLIIEIIASIFTTGSKDWNELFISKVITSDTDSNKYKSITLVKFLIS
jgi:hypothetical protein